MDFLKRCAPLRATYAGAQRRQFPRRPTGQPIFRDFCAPRPTATSTSAAAAAQRRAATRMRRCKRCRRHGALARRSTRYIASEASARNATGIGKHVLFAALARVRDFGALGTSLTRAALRPLSEEKTTLQEKTALRRTMAHAWIVLDTNPCALPKGRLFPGETNPRSSS